MAYAVHAAAPRLLEQAFNLKNTCKAHASFNLDTSTSFPEPAKYTLVYIVIRRQQKEIRTGDNSAGFVCWGFNTSLVLLAGNQAKVNTCCI